MSLVEGEIEPVGAPVKAGDPREGQPVELIVVVDDPRSADEAVAAFAADDAPVVPNYYIDQSGYIRQFVADARAGNGLELATYKGRRRNIDRLSLSVRLERPAGSDYSSAQTDALHRLLPFLLGQHGLDEGGLATILPDDQGRPRVFPYLPPPTSMDTGDLLGAGLDPAQELFVSLYAETYKPFGGALKIDQAFPIHAAKFGLGAPIGKNEPPPVTVAGRNFNIQPFARDTIFNEGTAYGAVQQLGALADPDRDEIPATGTIRAILDASYRVAIKAAKVAGVPVKGRENLEPGWRFHQVAHNASYGPPLSGNYVSDDGKYAVQVFPGETLYTPMTDQSGCAYLSTTDPADPAYAVIWKETYKVARAPYDPNADLHKKAVELRLGAPLTGAYGVSLGGAAYTVQVWALDTLYKGPDGQIKRMSELPKPPTVQTWQPAAPKPVPPTPPNPLPPATPPSNAGAPRGGDINWPPRPDFNIITDKGGAREKALGHIDYVRARGDFVTITNGWDGQNIIDVKIPQLLKIPGVRYDTVKFHRLAAGQLQRLWAAWEAA
ncbi:MAG: M15 family peptidase, partial [Chloroflexales bacterium]|nr:M15 family peptidase [Chloroflexales bacterium]